MADPEDIDVIGVEQLPDDPLKMPPPFWRSAGATLHIELALTELAELLTELVGLHTHTDLLLQEHYEKHQEDEADSETALEEFAEITDDLNLHEHAIRLKAEVACLMSAIEAEEELNRFCVFNLHKHIAESIETLSPPEKLLVAAAVLGHTGVKGESVFQAARRLAAWRNAFAHGHCVDRPTKSLRNNHLIYPKEYPGVPSGLLEVRELVGAYIRLSDYLRSISLNSYTAQESIDVENVRALTAEIAKYSFDGGNWAYDIILSQTEQDRIAKRLEKAIAGSSDGARARVENVIESLDPLRGLILRVEFGLDDQSFSSREALATLGISKDSLLKERAIALTQVVGLEHLLQNDPE